MTRTTRDKKKALDGQPWRDCGEKHCPWCEDDRQNVKIKAKLFIEDDEDCKLCGKPSFFSTCLKCEMDETYRGWNKK